ncbi:BglG family transcription antiterminator [Paenibacillus hodogayensis]|uniref:BglG family transcription antiterminator n=1 Tax=Paenibacillus hodogayensis TaxID=279208 RepID=A0ABV5VPQ5_9BACL
MSLTHRQRQILELLLGRPEEDVTAGQIAEEISVSTRTVHRELTELETTLSGSGLTLQKKSGKGIHLEGPADRLEAFRFMLRGITAVEYSAEERRVLILCMLLEKEEPIKLFALGHELQVTIPTITHDLDDLEPAVRRSDLILVRRRGYGVGLNGSEANKRKLISALAREGLDESELFGKSDGVRSLVTAKLLELSGKAYFHEVEDVLWQAEEAGLKELSDKAYTDLLLDISIAVARFLLGRRIELRAVNGGAVRQSELLTGIAVQLSRRLPWELPAAELAHIAGLLEAGAGADPNQLLPLEELEYMDIAWRLIRQMEARCGSGFTEDRSLRDGLLAHLESALKRLQSGLTIRNPLLAQIRKDYDTLFEDVRLAVNETITDLAIPDEEIGFLVMHFGASMERQKQFRRNVRAILVCTSGIGTSKMLAVRLTKELPQIDIVGNASWFEASRIPPTEYDLIISTVELPLSVDKYIKLSPLLTKEEAERLRLFIQNVTLGQEETESEGQEPPEEPAAASRLHRIRLYVNEIVSILDHFAVYRLDERFDHLEDALHAFCRCIAPTGTIEAAEPIVRLLQERERQSSQIIPDTDLALFHIRSGEVRRPSITLFRLSVDLPLDRSAPSGVRQVLLMLGPKQLSKESLEVLSEISSFLLLPEMIRLLREGSQEQIKQFLSQELAAFLEDR